MNRKHIIGMVPILLFLLVGLLRIIPDVIAEPAESTFYSTTSDGCCSYMGPTTYDNAWTLSTGEVHDDSTNAFVGQLIYDGDPTDDVLHMFAIYRAFFFFDTSSIPDVANIISAKVRLYVGDESDTDFNVTIQSGMPTYQHDPLQAGDYDKDHYSGEGGSFDTTNIVTLPNYPPESFVEIPLNSLGISWINKTGMTKFCLRSDREIAGIHPTVANNQFFYERLQILTREASNQEHYPKLLVTYALPSYTLTIHSLPTGVTFTINGVPQTTPYTEWLPAGLYTLEMPETHDGYVWSHWLEDGDTDRVKTISLPGTTWTGIYIAKPVGGVWTSIDKFELLAPYIGLASLITIATISIVYVKYRKKKQT